MGLIVLAPPPHCQWRGAAKSARLETMRKTNLIPVAVLLLTVVVAFPFVWHLAGDALVHLAIAERFALGEPFRYESSGPIVVASTSPFWTMLLAAYWRLAGGGSALLLKATVVGLWLGTALILMKMARRDWELPRAGAWAVGGLWLGHTTIVANALGGLENVLVAFQLLVLFRLVLAGRRTGRRALLVGALWGWMVITRPDGAIFGLAVIATSLWSARRWSLRQLLVMGVAAMLVAAPWYGYQWVQTGQLVTDSSLSRLYTGRQGALELWPGVIYAHPKTVISLATAFLPLVVGAAWFGLTALREGAGWTARKRHQGATAVLLLALGVAFYTFVVGGEAFGRYFLPLFPFLFLTGVWGLAQLHQLAAARRPRVAALLVAGAALLLLASSGLDYYRRVVTGRFESGPILNVIYGPANLDYFSLNLLDAVRAPAQRAAATDSFLTAVGASETPVRLALTEVQLRYFLDERVTLVSLDGRTSAEILPYFDQRRGVPDFEAYLAATRPDYVHAKQWCRVGGWLQALATSSMSENLICTWEMAMVNLEMGDELYWREQPLVVVAPELLRVEWQGQQAGKPVQVGP
jgi:hypothetical protein